MDSERLLAVGKELGYQGDELRKWIEDEKASAREERAMARQERELECAKLEKEREILQLRLAVQEAAGTSSERSRDNGEGGTNGQRHHFSPHKLIPQFNDARDDLDAYLQRFERTAAGLDWPQQKWATTLSLCLTGEALTVVGRMSPADALDYSKVKLALMQRFRYTKEGYRERFREAKPDDGETRKQFAARLAGYFDRWIEIAGVERTFEALRDKVLVEQFLQSCSSRLSVFLRERDCHTLEEVASKADLYLEAQIPTGASKPKVEELAKKSSTEDTERAARGGSRKTIRCFLCNKVGHKAENCRSRPSTSKTLTCWSCGRTGHRANTCGSTLDNRPQASCVWTVPSHTRCTEADESYVTLQDGAKIPVVNAAVGRAPKFLVENMPVVEGRLGDRKITVLRDTGCNTVVVRKEMIPPESFTGTLSPVFLLDRTVRYVPEAEILVRTPYFTGKVMAKCLSNPLYDLVLGNVPMVRGVNDPDPNWNQVEEMRPARRLVAQTSTGEKEEDSREGIVEKVQEGSSEPLQTAAPSFEPRSNEPMLTANTIETGRNKDLPRQPKTGLIVPQVSPLEATAEEMLTEQRNDESLKKCFRNIGKVTAKHGGRTTLKFFLRNNLLYRSCTFSSGRKTKQLVLPEKFRRTVVTMAHDGIMSGHQGMNNTIGLVAEEFF